MRILSFVAATILCVVGCTFYGVQALIKNSAVQKQSASEASSDIRTIIQKLSSGDARERIDAACRFG